MSIDWFSWFWSMLRYASSDTANRWGGISVLKFNIIILQSFLYRIPSLAHVHLGDRVGVDGETLVGVDDDAEQTGVGL